jgi:hypothetical protein
LPSAGYLSSKATGKYGIFKVFFQHHNKSYKNVHVKLEPALPCQKQHSTRRRSVHQQIGF